MIKPIKEPPVKGRRQFDETFKREAVSHWLASGKSAEVIAQELGFKAERLYAWRNRFAPADSGGRGSAGAKPGSPAALREIRHLREQRDILKNAGHHLRTVEQRYARIEAMKDDYSVQSLCDNLEVSPSGYYDWRGRPSCPGPRAAQNQALAQEIQHIHARSRQTCGSPRVMMELRQDGRRHGRNRVARLMQEAGLCGRQQRRYRVRTTDSNHLTNLSLPIVWPRPPSPPHPTNSGSPTSPTSKPRKAGSTSPPSSICSAAKSWAGP